VSAPRLPMVPDLARRGCPSILPDGRRVILGGSYPLSSGGVRFAFIGVKNGIISHPYLDSRWPDVDLSDPTGLFHARAHLARLCGVSEEDSWEAWWSDMGDDQWVIGTKRMVIGFASRLDGDNPVHHNVPALATITDPVEALVVCILYMRDVTRG